MNEQHFLELCKEKGYQNLPQFEAAVALAKRSLEPKKRLSGDTFFDHNLRVAAILADIGAAPEIILAGLLHGTGSDAAEEIAHQFGQEVLRLVVGVDEIKEIKARNLQKEAETVRKLILTTLTDLRVIFIKLANKLDNLRTSAALSREEQQRIAQEALEIYAPLAYRLGAEKLRTEIEDTAFQIVSPEAYEHIRAFLEASREEREAIVQEALRDITQLCAGKVQILRIKGRPKHLYSIYRKATQRQVPMEKQQDLLGMRIIVPDTKSCYMVLGLLHENFDPVEGLLKDYVANPKPNFYRSIHTALRLPPGNVLEVQIRTPEMDEFAEEGLAAHWRYKKLQSDEFFEKRIAWMKGVLDLQREGSVKEFLETVKVDVFGDKIYCYTPKGDVKELPKKATVLDFAFFVHEAVGSTAIGARVNGKFVPLKWELANGDVVEVLTNKSQRPRRGWLKIVTSGRAKQKIRKSLHEHEKLPALHYHLLKPLVTEEQGLLVEAPTFPKALCVLAKCCQALPGEAIIGLATKRRLISAHRSDCRHVLKEQERWITVQWKSTFNQKITFFVQVEERSGVLADLLHTIATTGFEVKEAKAKLINSQLAECSFVVFPKDLGHLQEVTRRVQNVRGVKRMSFE
ncbi:MAG TPA: HD domain-containing protein [Candidatus Nanoarchaeia archaeon]|nr:HD domain-containing protein [Candidatus Nanoarchaeia archaeon]